MRRWISARLAHSSRPPDFQASTASRIVRALGSGNVAAACTSLRKRCNGPCGVFATWRPAASQTSKTVGQTSTATLDREACSLGGKLRTCLNRRSSSKINLALAIIWASVLLKLFTSALDAEVRHILTDECGADNVCAEEG